MSHTLPTNCESEIETDDRQQTLPCCHFSCIGRAASNVLHLITWDSDVRDTFQSPYAVASRLSRSRVTKWYLKGILGLKRNTIGTARPIQKRRQHCCLVACRLTRSRIPKWYRFNQLQNDLTEEWNNLPKNFLQSHVDVR